LPRLAGPAKAAEMCASGEPIRAAEALQYGIIDKIIDGDLLAGAVAFARERAAQGGPPRKTRELTSRLTPREANLAALAAVREAVGKHALWPLAPLQTIGA